MQERKDDLREQLRLKLANVMDPQTPIYSPKKDMNPSDIDDGQPANLRSHRRMQSMLDRKSNAFEKNNFLNAGQMSQKISELERQVDQFM